MPQDHDRFFESERGREEERVREGEGVGSLLLLVAVDGTVVGGSLASLFSCHCNPVATV